MNINDVLREKSDNPALLTDFEIYEIAQYARDRLTNETRPPRGPILRILTNILRLCQESTENGE